MRRLLIYIVISNFVLFFIGCNKEEIKEMSDKLSKVEQKNHYLHSIAQTLVSAMNESKAFRYLLRAEIDKQFDYQHDVLYEAIKDKMADGTSVRELLQRHYNKFEPNKNFEEAVYSLRYLQFSVPIHFSNWDANTVLPVAVLPADWDEVKMSTLYLYNPDGSVSQISAKEAPDFPVIVVGEAERIDAQGKLIVDANGMVLTPEDRISYTKAIAMAERQKSLKEPVNKNSLILVLSNDSFARMQSMIEIENKLRIKEQQRLIDLINQSTQKLKKSSLISNEKKLILNGFSTHPKAITLSWNNPTNYTLRYYIYAMGYFNINGVKTFKEKQLLRLSDNLTETILLDYPYELYALWLEGKDFKDSFQTNSNYLLMHTSERKNNSREIITKYYFSASKIKEIEGWYVNDIELAAHIVLAINIGKENQSIVYNYGGMTITARGAFSIWGGWKPIDTERIVAKSDSSRILFDWSRNMIGSTNTSEVFDNGVYTIQWREYDAGYLNSQKLDITIYAIKYGTRSFIPSSICSEYLYEIGTEKVNVYLFDEDLGENFVLWWDKPNTTYNSSNGFSVKIGFE